MSKEVNHNICKRRLYEKYLKRPLDFGLASLTLVALSPVIATTALLVKRNLGSPILFVQERPGLNEKPFKLIKFKSMLEPQTLDGQIITDEERTEMLARGLEVLSDEDRLTQFGRRLRATSLDELPELINIIKGDMAIVGPRSLSTAYLPYYNDYERHRHDVRPGLTGLAQINGRNTASWDEKFYYDVEYTKDISFIGDLKIILKTIAVVMKREGIGQGKETPESFHVVRQAEWDKERGK